MSATIIPYPLGPVDAIPLGEARVFDVDGRNIAVFRSRTGEVFAASAECPHRSGPLADGLIGGHSVVCPLHGFVFDLRTGEAAGRECGQLAIHKLSIGTGGHMTVEIA